MQVSGGAFAAESLPRVPEGFTIEKVAAAPLVGHPMMGCFDDRGRLFLTCAAGENLNDKKLLESLPNFVQLLEDTDGDGHFDKSTVFADKMTMPMGAAWYRGALYVASPPSIWRLEDTDGDGRADRREELVNKFGFNGNGADIHGCFLGPEGRLYWTDGRHGHEFTDADGNVISKGLAARIFSCRPDGSDIETYCGGGMDNPVEIIFTPEGEMLGTANIMLSDPRVDVLAHWVEGGVYPRFDQENCIAEFPRTGDLLPPLAKLGHVAVSGLAQYRSTHFGLDYRNSVFVTLFNTHSVVRLALRPAGATFTAERHEFLVSDNPDFHPTDVLEDADGSLLVIDTGGWFRIGCPTSQIAKPEILGAIYRIRRNGGPVADDPRGMQINFDAGAPEALVRLLDDERPAVVDRAIDRLAARGEAAVPALRAALKQPSETARRNAVWTLSRIETDGAREGLREALADSSESVRLAALRAVGSGRDPEAVDSLIPLVKGDSPAVRREAATALGRIVAAHGEALGPGARQRVVDVLLAALRGPGVDRFAEHAMIFAVLRANDAEATRPYLADGSPNVRRAALIVLDQLEDAKLSRDEVVPLLDTDAAALQQEALAVISRHEGWAGEMRELLRKWLADDAITAERQAMLRGFFLARAGDEEIQALVAEALNREGLSAPVRRLLLETIDRAPLAELPGAWIECLGRSLAGPEDIATDAVRILRARKIDRFDEQLTQIAHDVTRGKELRVAALWALAPRAAGVDGEIFEFLVAQLQDEASSLERLAAAQVLAESPLSDEQLLELADRIAGAGPLAAPVLVRAYAHSQDARVGSALVAALEREPAGGVSPAELAAILEKYPENVREQARPILSARGLDVQAQRERLEGLVAATVGGNAERGHEVFFGKKAACSGCHTVRGTGGKVGPNLSTIGSIRTRRDLLEAIAFPSASFAREFNTYVVVTDEGRVHTGVISRQTADSISLRGADLSEVRIPRKSIEEIRESPTSIMPEGLDRILSAEELADVVAYLQSLTGP